ncbi:MAG: ABC transporter ATP-binding protein [Verrucomicrobia bacterium]|jgi:cobalt/nickel transport system ATP-binding protein|nr:ABC transporter ATP-binding protein [Verrucomicrobiota bacterium]
MDSRTLITLKNLTFGYPQCEPVLKEAELEIRAGERIGLIGAIGSGKTTLLHAIVGLLRPDRGTIEVFDQARQEERDFWEVRERVGLLFQDPDDQLFCPTVQEDIAFGPLNQGKRRSEIEGIVHRSLGLVGLEGFEDRITHHLSGGEKRLVSLAAVLAMEPDVLLLDEPENGLDPPSYERIRSLLLSLPQAMIIVSHNVEFLQAVTTRCLRLEEGGIKSHLGHLRN